MSTSYLHLTRFISQRESILKLMREREKEKERERERVFSDIEKD